MRPTRFPVAALALALCVGATYGVQRKDVEEGTEPDIPMEPTLPKAQVERKSIPAGNMQFSDKIPWHLAEHYRKNGLDGVVYFSFCIA